MKRIITTFITCLSILLLVSACNKTEYDIYSNISGTVIDVDNGEPLAQATVTLTPGGLNAYTDTDGHFEFKDLEAQQYTLRVQKTGYQANSKTVNAPSGETVNVSITMKKQ